MQDYLMNRRSIVGVVLVMDIRHPMKEFDEMMLEWAANNNVKVHALLTKSDKLKRGPAQATMLKIMKEMKTRGVEASAQTYSGLNGDGVDQLREKLAQWLQLENTSEIPVNL